MRFAVCCSHCQYARHIEHRCENKRKSLRKRNHGTHHFAKIRSGSIARNKRERVICTCKNNAHHTKRCFLAKNTAQVRDKQLPTHTENLRKRFNRVSNRVKNAMFYIAVFRIRNKPEDEGHYPNHKNRFLENRPNIAGHRLH